ncbi:MAG: GNAT family N-acetyltransferase [Saprospiraceae bacterium]|nr:GNAT family N-acetyltransferase [Saprospiraceae bacterium]MDG2418532.1 GNAT family N-acetyltransferase [Saprospiraceae bacterium]
MKFHIQTDRLILREWRMEDAFGILKLNSNPDVIKYLHLEPMKTEEEALDNIKWVTDQYSKNKIGRWIMLKKSTNEFMGWTGLKLEDMEMNGNKYFYDVGYRILPKFWGKGYATESVIASVKYGFEEMKLNKINAAAHCKNIASCRVLQKVGFEELETFKIFNFQAYWFEYTKGEYFSKK